MKDFHRDSMLRFVTTSSLAYDLNGSPLQTGVPSSLNRNFVHPEDSSLFHACPSNETIVATLDGVNEAVVACV